MRSWCKREEEDRTEKVGLTVNRIFIWSVVTISFSGTRMEIRRLRSMDRSSGIHGMIDHECVGAWAGGRVARGCGGRGGR